MQIYLWVEHKSGLAGTEEMNNVIVEKRLCYIYISKQFWEFCVSHTKENQGV